MRHSLRLIAEVEFLLQGKTIKIWPKPKPAIEGEEKEKKWKTNLMAK